MPDSLEHLAQHLNRFARDRDWQQFHVVELARGSSKKYDEL